MKRNLRSWAVGFLVLCLVAGAVYYLLRPKPIAVEAATVTYGPLAQTVDAEAKTRVHDRYIVAATVSGRISRLSLLEGDRVKAGSTIASIDPVPSTAAIRQALSQIRELEEQKAGVETLRPKSEAIAQAEGHLTAAQGLYRAAIARSGAASAAYEQATREAQRASTLERNGYLPRAQLESARLNEMSRHKDLDAAQAAVHSAAADVETQRAAIRELRAKQFDPEYLRRVYDARIASIEAGLKPLEDQASRTTVRAPVAGSVLRVLQKNENFVAAGTPLVELGDLRHLEIVADVLSTDAVRMRPGNPITVVRGAGDRELRGRVRVVEPAGYTKVSALGVEEQRVNVIGDFGDPAVNLGDQYRLDVQITTWRADRVLRVPLAALFRCETAWCAFAVDGNRAKRTRVQTGHKSGTDAEVLSGLKASQRVILHPSDRIEDGVRIRERSTL